MNWKIITHGHALSWLALCFLLPLVAHSTATPQGLLIYDQRTLHLASAEYSHSVSPPSLDLKAVLPDELALADEQIQWSVRQAGLPIRELRGRKHLLHLEAGTYQVELTIGRFQAHKTVEVQRGRTVTPYFRADIGRLQMVANQQVDWLVQAQSRRGIDFRLKASQQLDTIVPAGTYDVKTLICDKPQRQRVQVASGQDVSAVVQVPVGQVNLIAMEDNRPLFKAIEWKVFRLENGQRYHVGDYHLHSQGITIPPGYYEVVATHNSTVRSRQFWVRENTSNKVVLAMD